MLKNFSQIVDWCRSFFFPPREVRTSLPTIEQHEEFLFSRYLDRDVHLSLFLPNRRDVSSTWPIVFFNDGQDMEAVSMRETLNQLVEAGQIPPLMVIGIHANEDRMREYGIIGIPDYQGRGDLAKAHCDFLIKELLPSIHSRFPQVRAGKHLIAGFSLGGLSAFDIGCRHSEVFSGVGVFSGSFWWRSKAFDPVNPDGDLIVPSLLQYGRYKSGIRFWFQTGTHDELSDRNGNGVIDAIDDTLMVMDRLVDIGYNRQTEIRYVEVEGGEHNPYTWGQILPDFLIYHLG